MQTSAASTTPISVKTRTWYTKVFFYLLEISKVNAFRLYLASRHPSTPANKRPSLLQFTLELVEELLGDHTSNIRMGHPILTLLDSRLMSCCMPGTFPNRSWCHVCWIRVSHRIQEKRRHTEYGCLSIYARQIVSPDPSSHGTELLNTICMS